MHPAIGWRETLDALPGLGYALGVTGELERVNACFARYAGLSRERIERDRWREIVHPDDLAASQAALRSGIATGSLFRTRFRIRSAEGEDRVHDFVTSPLRESSGEIALWIGLATDVEEEVRAGRVLAASERRPRELLDAVPQIVWTADATGWIDWYNARWYRFTGQTPEEAAGWGWQDAHHPEDFPEVMRRWPHSIATGEPFEMEFRLRRADGVFRWMLTRVIPLRDRDGTVVRWYGSNTEIDDQKNAQHRSTRVAQLLQEALLPQSLPIGEGFRFDAIYEPAGTDARIGGDWYDAFALPSGEIVITVGDVTGHGIEAAAHAARLRQNLAFAASEDPDPARVLARVNRMMVARELAIATACVARFDPASATVTYALAGHPPPIVVDAAGVALGEPGGISLGVIEAFATDNRTVALPPGGLFALYTDGITEQHRDIELAERALCDAARAIVGAARVARPAELLRDAALGDARTLDDCAIIVLERSAPDRAPADLGLSRTWRYHASHARAGHLVRRKVVEYLEMMAADTNAVFEAELVLGEIIANTVEHAPGLVEIRLEWERRRPRVRVRDHGVARSGSLAVPDAAPHWPADLYAENGRGLPIVYAFATDVTIESFVGGGTELACTLPVERAMRRSARV